jgi:hypothetical protein
MVINAHINQADVTRLSVGQEVDIQIESIPGLTMKGVVERLAPQSMIKNSIKGYPARIAMKEIDPRVRPGMTANVSIPVASADHAVAVPLAAVFTEQGERFVYVKTGEEEFEKRSIQIGIADYDHAEVLSGLTAGEVVSLEDRRPKASQALSGLKPPGAAGARAAEGTGGRGAGAQPGGRGSESSTAAGGQRPGHALPAGTRPAGGGSVGR